MNSCGWASLRANIRKGKNSCTTAAGRSSEKKPCRQQGECRRRAGSAPGLTAEVPLVERPMVEQVISLQPMVYRGKRDLHTAAREGAPHGAGGCGLEEAVAHGESPQEQTQQTPGQSCSPWRGAHTGAGDLGESATRVGHMLEQFAPGGWTSWCGSILEQFLKSCCMQEAHTGSVQEGQ